MAWRFDTGEVVIKDLFLPMIVLWKHRYLKLTWSHDDMSRAIARLVVIWIMAMISAQLARGRARAR